MQEERGTEKKKLNIETLTGKGDMMDSAEMENYVLERTESQTNLLETADVRDVYSNCHERRYLQAVSEGDVEMVKDLGDIENKFMDCMSTLAKSSLKQMEYMTVVNAALISRAAVQGGANPRMIWNLSDMYMQKLEKCRTIAQMRELNAEMTLDFTERVRKAKLRPQGHVYVEKVKDYVALRLRTPFTISEMAEELRIGRTYLSRLFHGQEGITIQNYVLQERLSHAANMLRFSDCPIAVITEYFCFSSQSYFGRRFKKQYGVTPWEYRKKNRYVEGVRRE
jgi:AraC-like DNA-binding protein